MQHLLSILLSYSLVTLLTLSPTQGQDGCTVSDSSYVLDQGSCGNQEWDLGVDWGGGVRDPFETDWAYGACDGGYYDCDNTYVAQSYISAGESFRDDGPIGYEEEDVHWEMDSWTVSFTSCNNGNPQDEVEKATNTPFNTSDYEVFCD